MRLLIAAVSSLFVASLVLGCGGAAIPTPSETAKAGPPPGTSPDMIKVVDPKTKKK